MSLPFLLEIGTEEIPDWMIRPGLDRLAEGFQNLLKTNRFGAPMPAVDGTPRRLTLRASNMPAGRPDIVKSEEGPLVATGERAAQGFAKKHSVSVGDLEIFDSPGGPKYRVQKIVPGKSMQQILADDLRGVILGIPWPKTMYWTEDKNLRFIRPIRWVVALLGNEVIPFEIAGIKSGNVTSGHRILGAPQVPVTIDSYEQKLRENFVILSAKEREDIIRTKLGSVATDAGDLVTKLVYLTEFPTVIQGSFDQEFLALPQEVLVTVMKHHQNYFAVAEPEPEQRLTTRFSAVVNTNADPDGQIRRGNERVLRARFKDAKFFWDTDLRKKLVERLPDLAQVTFQAKLGSYLEKTNRIVALVKELGGDNTAIEAARLSKCDLTTELVKELPELQGQVGGLYKLAQKEPDEEPDDVWFAIYWQYFPVRMEDPIPPSTAGRLLSIADKLDTLCSCFGVGLIPTGSKDPFALRRGAQGIVKILVEGELRIPIRKFLNGDPKLEEFFLDRVRYYFKDIRGFKYDEVNAVLAAGWDDLKDVEERLGAIQSVRPTEDFEPLAASFKRIRNILRQAQFRKGEWITEMPPDPGAEQSLYDAIVAVREQVDAYRRKKDYRSALETIAGLRPIVDNFFDQVLVNDPDLVKRQRRLWLLDRALESFSTIADFSEIVTNT